MTIINKIIKNIKYKNFQKKSTIARVVIKALKTETL